MMMKSTGRAIPVIITGLIIALIILFIVDILLGSTDLAASGYSGRSSGRGRHRKR